MLPIIVLILHVVSVLATSGESQLNSIQTSNNNLSNEFLIRTKPFAHTSEKIYLDFEVVEISKQDDGTLNYEVVHSKTHRTFR